MVILLYVCWVRRVLNSRPWGCMAVLGRESVGTGWRRVGRFVSEMRFPSFRGGGVGDILCAPRPPRLCDSLHCLLPLLATYSNVYTMYTLDSAPFSTILDLFPCKCYWYGMDGSIVATTA